MSKFRQYDKYEVYDDGRIWSYSRNKWLKPKTDRDGYQIVCLSDNECKRKWYKVHRIVYETFSGSPIPENLEINHIDERKDNNSKSNLELVSHKQNVNWGTCIKRMKNTLTNGKRSKQVGAFKNGELIFVFPSANEAGRQGFYESNVAKCCRGKLKTYKGYTWKYL